MERLGSRLEININRITKLTRGAVMTILVMTAITFGTFSILQAQEPDPCEIAAEYLQKIDDLGIEICNCNSQSSQPNIDAQGLTQMFNVVGTYETRWIPPTKENTECLKLLSERDKAFEEWYKFHDECNAMKKK